MGKLEFGSPKRRRRWRRSCSITWRHGREATAFGDAIADLREGARWTDYQRMFERYPFSGKFPKE